MSSNRERASILYGQGRYDLALEQILLCLAEDPDDADLHRLAGECLLRLDRYDEATSHAKAAIGLDPNDPDAHLLAGRIALHLGKNGEALSKARQARDLDPDDPAPWGLMSAAQIQKKSWKLALSAAEEGLQREPDDEVCLAMRAQALMGLGRHDEAAEDVQRNLELAPDDGHNHAAAGWQAMQLGKAVEARQHFLEALRLEPDNEWARSGLIESIKAANILYRWFFQLLLWLEKLPSSTLIIILIGTVFARRMARQAAESNPELVLPANLFVWGLFALFVALMILQPLANLGLFLHPLGRHALSKGERIQALALLGGFLPVLAGLTAIGLGWPLAEGIALTAVLVLPPLAFGSTPGLVAWSRIALLAIVAGSWALWGVVFGSELMTYGLASPSGRPSAEEAAIIARNTGFMSLLTLVLVAFTWFGSFLIKHKPR